MTALRLTFGFCLQSRSLEGCGSTIELYPRPLKLRDFWEHAKAPLQRPLQRLTSRCSSGRHHYESETRFLTPPSYWDGRRKRDCGLTEQRREPKSAPRPSLYREGCARSAVIVSRGVYCGPQPSGLRAPVGVKGIAGAAARATYSRHFEDPTLDASNTTSTQTRARIAGRATPLCTSEPRWPCITNAALTSNPTTRLCRRSDHEAILPQARGEEKCE